MVQLDKRDWNTQECYSSGNVNAGCLREVVKRSRVNFQFRVWIWKHVEARRFPDVWV